MIIHVHTLKEGLVDELQIEFDPHKLDLEFIDFHYVQPIRLEGAAERIRETITFRGTLSSEVEQICNRCLRPVATKLSAPFDFSYEAGTQETIDTTDDLRDILILCHPDRFLCRPSCRGICSHCGADLNQEACRCVLHE